MTDYGSPWNVIIFLEALIWFVLIAYLIYLTIKTRLTYVEDFRKNFLAGIFILLICSSLFVITQHFLTLPEEFYNIFNIFVLIGLLISSSLIILGLFRLDGYVYSIIGVEGKTSKLIIFLLSLPGPILIFIINLIIGITPSGMMVSITMVLTYIIFYFIFIYAFFIHKEMHDLKIDMMAYFGTGFLFQVANQILGLFNASMFDGLYFSFFQIFYVLLMIFLVAGYLNFKNRIKTIK